MSSVLKSFKSVLLAITTLSSVFVLADIAAADAINTDKIECNKKQTKCMITTNQVTIGDEIGVFNKRGELVARGKIKAMRDDRRALVVERRHGRIQRDSSLALLNRSENGRIKRNFKVYKRPAKSLAGASIGLATMGIGTGTPSIDASVFGAWRKWDIQWVARMNYLRAEGEVSRTLFEGIETRPVSVQGVGLLGGAALQILENRTIGFRFEAAVGGFYGQATVAEDAELAAVEAFDVRIANGFDKYVRGSASVLWNAGPMHVDLSVAPTLVHNAFGTTISLGLIKKLK